MNEPKQQITLTASVTKPLCIFEVKIGHYTIFKVIWSWQLIHDLGVYMVNKALQHGAKPGVEAPANKHAPFEIIDGGRK